MKYLRFVALFLLGTSAFAATNPVGKPYVYKTVDGRDLRLWVRVPDNAAPGVKRPAIVFIHGGGWVGGGPQAFAPQSDYLASRGMVAVQVQYRLLKQQTNDPPTVCIQDSKSAMRWVRKHAAEFGIDPDRIAASGGSAGGHLSAFLGLMEGLDDPADDLAISAKPNALILFNPVIDNGPDGWGSSRTGEDYMKYSPFHHVHAGAPPTIVLAAGNDKLISPATLLAFCDAMKKAGVRCEITVYPGQPHGFFNNGKSYYETLKAADEFLASLGWLQGPPTLKPEDAPVMSARKNK